MKNIIIGLLTATLLFSCNDDDYFFQNNHSPKIYFSNNDSISETIEIVYKLNTEDLIINFKYEDDQKIDSFYVIQSQGSSGIKFLNDTQLSIRPYHTGIHNYKLFIVDPYLIDDFVNINIDVFKNLSPVALIDISENEYFITLDASSSYDADKEFGGYIKNYKFIVNGETVYQGTKSTILLNKSQEINIYNIKLQVTDNDDAISENTYIYESN